MFTGIKKFILKYCCKNKLVSYQGFLFNVKDVFPDYVLVQTPNFVKHIQNKDVSKIKFVKNQKDEYHRGQYVSYYDQQLDEMRTGTVDQVLDSGVVKMNDGAMIYANHIGIPYTKKRLYKKGCLFKHDGMWFTIESWFLTENGYCYNCNGDDLLGHVFSEKEINEFNK